MLVLVPTAFEANLLFGADTAEVLGREELVRAEIAGQPAWLALCGFGLAAAGAGAAHVFGCYARMAREDRLHQGPVLVGLAGSYRPEVAPVGSVVIGTAARCHGIGVGEGAAHLPAETLGWQQGVPRPGRVPLGDLARLTLPPALPGSVLQGQMLSVTAASADPAEAAARAAQYPEALAEEMEAFAVALAAQLYDLPLTVVRGISNVAGDREKSRWRSAAALEACRAALEQLARGEWSER